MLMHSDTISVQPLNILLIDDEMAILKIVTNYFKDKHVVYTCNNGSEGLQWIYNGNYPDIIITDFNMPVIDGLSFLKTLKSSALYCKIPVIFLSGHNNTETKIKCLDEGADDFLIKPFNPAELEARIHSIFRRANYQLI